MADENCNFFEGVKGDSETHGPQWRLMSEKINKQLSDRRERPEGC